MTKLGITQMFSLQIKGIKKVFKTKATVIMELSDDLDFVEDFYRKSLLLWHLRFKEMN